MKNSMGQENSRCGEFEKTIGHVKRQWATTAVNVQTLRPNNMSQNLPFQPLYVANVDNRNDDNHVYNDFTDQENSYGRLGNYDGGDEETAGPRDIYVDVDEFSLMLTFGKGFTCFMDTYNLRGDLYGEWHQRWENIPADVCLPFPTSVLEYTGCTSKMILRKHNLCAIPPLSDEEKKEGELVGATTPSTFYAYLCHLAWLRCLKENEQYRRPMDRLNTKANEQYLRDCARTREEIEDWVCKRFQLLCAAADIEFQKVFLWYAVEKEQFDRNGPFHHMELNEALYKRFKLRRLLDCLFDAVDYITLHGIENDKQWQNPTAFYELGLSREFIVPFHYTA